jgi:hypothetical protein
MRLHEWHGAIVASEKCGGGIGTPEARMITYDSAITAGFNSTIARYQGAGIFLKSTILRSSARTSPAPPSRAVRITAAMAGHIAMSAAMGSPGTTSNPVAAPTIQNGIESAKTRAKNVHTDVRFDSTASPTFSRITHFERE